MKASHYNNFKMNGKEFEHFQRAKESFHQVASKLNADTANKYRTLNNHLKWNVIKRQFRKIHRRDHHQHHRNHRNHQQDIEKVSENKHVEQALLSRDKMLEIINSAMMVSAYNIFAVITLDGSLIFRIISTTTTYIIILLQYSGEGDICKATESGEKTV
uniref:Uncharacterized protein n=1 Tax=Glossina austeni TaxID=7395 RepID=A0A1A9VU74_GLOAU